MKNITAVLLIFGIFLLYLYYTRVTNNFSNSKFKLETYFHYFQDMRYLVNSNICRIPDLNPFDPEFRRHFWKADPHTCGPSELLTYVTVTNNTATLYINQDVASQYTENLTCFYRKINRVGSGFEPDNYIAISVYQKFENSVQLDFDFVFVVCENNAKVIYSNTHAPITVKKNVADRQRKMKNKDKAFSVLILGIDSISRLNFIRSFTKTHLFLLENNWIALKGYNKIADNTYPNLMAILTGLDPYRSERKCPSQKLKALDKCPMIWYDFQKLGYATAYAEDDTEINTFNLDKKGFKKPPTDYYFRPYFLCSENLGIDYYHGLKFCTGPENTGQRVLNIARDFADTFKNRPNFGLFWMNSFSHNNLHVPAIMDFSLREFFVNLMDSGALQNSFVFFLSDHGLREGPFRQTSLGWFEERLPFFYIWLPLRFQVYYANEHRNLLRNADKLTSPYDLYMTLQDILVYSGTQYSVKPSRGCHKCKSLFSEIVNERSCRDAGISDHWCTCIDYFALNRTSDIVRNATKFVIDSINTIVKENMGVKICKHYSFGKVLRANMAENGVLILLALEMIPRARFEVTLSFQPNSDEPFSLKSGISRTDRYKAHSSCTKDPLLKKLCFCK